jgi:hypothetical protein
LAFLSASLFSWSAFLSAIRISSYAFILSAFGFCCSVLNFAQHVRNLCDLTRGETELFYCCVTAEHAEVTWPLPTLASSKSLQL